MRAVEPVVVIPSATKQARYPRWLNALATVGLASFFLAPVVGFWSVTPAAAMGFVGGVLIWWTGTQAEWLNRTRYAKVRWLKLPTLLEVSNPQARPVL
jgi:hypothetical protein